MSVEEDVKAAVDATVARFGRLDVALSSAGVILPSQTLTSKDSLDMARFRKTMDINVFGSVMLAKYSAVAMAKNKPDENGERGLILFVTSIAASEGQRGQVGYSASKAAL